MTPPLPPAPPAGYSPPPPSLPPPLPPPPSPPSLPPPYTPSCSYSATPAGSGLTDTATTAFTDPQALAPSQLLSVTIPVAGLAADVSEADRAAVGVAIAAAAGVDASLVQIAVRGAADGSVQLVAYIRVQDDAATPAEVALDASFGDVASATAALAPAGVVLTAAPVVSAPAAAEPRRVSVTIAVAGSADDLTEDDEAAVAAATAAAAGVDVSAVQIAIVEAAGGSVRLVATIMVADDVAAIAAEAALDASFGDQARATAALESAGVVPTAAPVVSAPVPASPRMLSMTVPVTGSAADVSEEDRAAVAAAIAAAAGLDVSEVQVSVIEAADGSVDLVVSIAVGDDAAALADVESALDASFGDAAGVTAALAAGGLVPTASPVVIAPPPPLQRQCYVSVSVKNTGFNPNADDEYIIRTTANGEEIHGRCSPYDGAAAG